MNLDSEESELRQLLYFWNWLLCRLDAMHGTCLDRDIGLAASEPGTWFQSDDRLCARVCDSVFCARLFPWYGKMDSEIFRYRHEDWRSCHDSDGYFVVYRPNDQNYDLAQYDYAGMACILKGAWSKSHA